MTLRTVLSFSRSFLSTASFQYSCTFVNKASLRSIYSNSILCLPRKAPSSPSSSIPLNISDKYKVFDDKDAVIIQNTSEETFADQLAEEEFDEFDGLNLERGKTGVFEIEELVSILKQENVQDIFVSVVPTSIQYSDYICVVTGRSLKHNLAIAEFLHRLYKRKRHPQDLVPKIEGRSSKEWIALDLGNIVVHIFSEEFRRVYDLELLWSVGPDYDDQCKKYTDVSEIIEKHAMYLADLTPADEK